MQARRLSIRARTVRQTEQLLSLRDSLGLQVDDETLLSLAERAWSQGRNPAALFRWMLSHPESWGWVSDEDQARGRKRLRCQRRQPDKATRRSRSFPGSLVSSVQRRYGVFPDPRPSTGWEAEAEMTTRAYDRRIRRRARREKWEALLGVLVLGVALLWMFF